MRRKSKTWAGKTWAGKTWAAAGLLGLCLAAAALTPATAQDAAPGKPPQDSPSALAREGLERMMRALRLLVENVPQYELPEVLENGDIIIRRKRGDKPHEDPEFDETAT
jgi:hypothetical protein